MHPTEIGFFKLLACFHRPFRKPPLLLHQSFPSRCQQRRKIFNNRSLVKLFLFVVGGKKDLGRVLIKFRTLISLVFKCFASKGLKAYSYIGYSALRIQGQFWCPKKDLFILKLLSRLANSNSYDCSQQCHLKRRAPVVFSRAHLSLTTMLTESTRGTRERRYLGVRTMEVLVAVHRNIVQLSNKMIYELMIINVSSILSRLFQ